MSLEQEVELIRGIQIFSKIPPAKQKLLCFSSERLTYPAGEVLFREGDVGDACYVIIEGTTDVSVNSLVISTLGRNQIIGEIAVFGHGPRTATVTATTRLEVLRFSGDLFRSVVRENADAAVEMCRILAGRLANTTLLLQQTTLKLEQLSNPSAK